MSKTITLTEHRPADGLLTMRVRNTTYNVNIFFNPNAKSTLDLKCEKSSKKKRKQEIFDYSAAFQNFILTKASLKVQSCLNVGRPC